MRAESLRLGRSRFPCWEVLQKEWEEEEEEEVVAESRKCRISRHIYIYYTHLSTHQGLIRQLPTWTSRIFSFYLSISLPPPLSDSIRSIPSIERAGRKLTANRRFLRNPKVTDALPQRRSLDIDLCLPLRSLSLSISCSIYLSTDLGEGTPASDRRIGASADNSPPHTSTYTAGAHTDTHIHVHVRAKIDARLFRHRRVHALIPRRLNLPLMPPVIETLAKTPFLPPKPTTTRISKFPYISFFRRPLSLAYLVITYLVVRYYFTNSLS